MCYSIIIPIHNEAIILDQLLPRLKEFVTNKHEIIIVDDGSTDESTKILDKYKFIHLIKLKKNSGKGFAIKSGLKSASNEKIIIFDGDMELDPSDINKLMILNEKDDICCVFGTRFDRISAFSSLWDFGNFFFTWVFNAKNNCRLTDALCCAKAFYKKDIDIFNIKSSGFDIDIELANILIKMKDKIIVKKIRYTRRTVEEGKKLKLIDGWSILKRLL